MTTVVKEVELNEPPKDGISNLVFSPTGHLLLAASWDCSIRVYDTNSNGLNHLSFSKAPVLDACFGGVNSTVFSAGLDREVTM
jgi:WD40 repeat protein